MYLTAVMLLAAIMLLGAVIDSSYVITVIE